MLETTMNHPGSELSDMQGHVLSAAAQAQLYESIQLLLQEALADALGRLARPGGPQVAARREVASLKNAVLVDVRSRSDARELSTRTVSELLSRRERQVLERIAAGASNKSIARDLNLSPHTVKRHVANILDKLGATSRFEAGRALSKVSKVPGREFV
jgi:DNA-binding NarL/FixJ family response regulator